jgi:hypothetical protein
LTYRWEHRLRILKKPNGKYIVIEERKNKSAIIRTNEVDDKETAERRKRNLSKELGIR